MIRYCNFFYYLMATLFAMLGSTGCMAKNRNNSSEFRVAYVDSKSGAPVWVEKLEEWNNTIKSGGSKSAINGIEATEKRDSDGGYLYTAQADGVSTSPELKTLDRMLDMADRMATRFGVPEPANALQPTNTERTQIILTPQEYEQLLSGSASGGNDTGGELVTVKSLSPEDQDSPPDGIENRILVSRVYAGRGTEPEGNPTPPAPTLQLTPDQLDRLQNLLADPGDMTTADPADGENDRSEANPQVPPATPVEG